MHSLVSASAPRRTRTLAAAIAVLTVTHLLLIATAKAETTAAPAAHHGHAAGHQHDLELGLSPGLVYLAGEKEFTAGLHAHLVLTLGQSSWAVGIGYERLLDEHGHNTLSAVVQVRLTGHWSVAVAPGLSFDADTASPAAHFETAYEHAFGRFHIGPSLELAVDLDDVHLTLGLHLGVGL